MFFAELGARVIKIENKAQGGDITRKWKLPDEDPLSSNSAYYSSVNWRKQTVFLDLEVASDRAEALELIRETDIVIANFREGSAARFGVDYPSLAALNPGLIYAQIHGFGRDDPRPAFDVVMQAETGYLSMTGEKGRDPVKMPVALIDILAAHQLKEGILIALLRRERSGSGALVSVSLWDAAIASLANQASNWLMARHIPQPMGSLHPNIAPYGEIFYCADGKALVLAVGTDRHFVLLCQCLGLPELAARPDFAENTSRVRNRSDLQDALRPAFGRFSREEIMRRLDESAVPAGRIRNLEEVFESAETKDLILTESLPDGTITKRVKTAVFHID